jgi:hypothetical protein
MVTIAAISGVRVLGTEMRDQEERSSLRECLLEPIPECFDAAALLSAAVDAHLAGQALEATRLIGAADLPAVRKSRQAEAAYAYD